MGGSYILKKEGPKSFDLAAACRLKLPTANKNLGLGTGEIDQGAGLEFAKELNQDLTLLADGNADPRELSGTLDYKSTSGNQYSGGLLLGLSDGSPGLGLSVGLSRRF
ncbi:MAG: hypothetical protein Q8O90_05035 [Elusimicrobiota bacterium]|nr:hypothetical protein [Elusimicrobiota bacterium]